MRPGGKIELADMDIVYISDDGTVTEDNNLARFTNDITAAASRGGRDLRVAPRFADLLAEHAFESVRQEVLKLPMGPWPKDKTLKMVGYCHREQFLQGLAGIGMGLFTRVLRWSKEEVEVYLAKVREDVGNRKFHGYWRR